MGQPVRHHHHRRHHVNIDTRPGTRCRSILMCDSTSTTAGDTGLRRRRLAAAPTPLDVDLGGSLGGHAHAALYTPEQRCCPDERCVESEVGGVSCNSPASRVEAG